MALILNGTDGLSDVDGTAATPAIRGTDTNTGIFFPAADTIAFSEGGTEAMRLNSSGDLQMNSGYGSVATAYGCRAWVNFNGTGTVAIRASGNVSSITDGGTGTYTVNFAMAMPDANYSAQVNTQSDGNARAANANINTNMSDGLFVSPTSAAFRLGTYNTATNGAFDSAGVSVAVFR
jgi:hypothetical protein